MAEEKFMLFSLDDPKTKSLADVLSNKTSRKIINYLAENKEASQKDLSDALSISMTTLDYNMKKLLSSGLVQKRKNFFWSKKGKKIVMYELSNKSVVISPKRANSEKLKSILPAFLLTLSTSALIYAYEKIFLSKEKIEEVYFYAKDTAVSAMAERAPEVATTIGQSTIPYWLWFLVGGLFVIFIFSIINWRKL